MSMNQRQRDYLGAVLRYSVVVMLVDSAEAGLLPGE
jgi:hypothetical protein